MDKEAKNLDISKLENLERPKKIEKSKTYNLLLDVDLELSVENNITAKKIDKVLHKYLSSREYQIMYMRYGLSGGDEMTQQEVADILKISRSYVSRIETKVQEKLKKHIKYEA